MDIERTKQFYRELKQSDLCGCAYCRNYVKEAAKAYPAVTAYLQTLGVDIAKPFETMPLELDEDGRMPYIGPQYLVFGAEAGFAAATVKDANDVEVRAVPPGRRYSGAALCDRDIPDFPAVDGGGNESQAVKRSVVLFVMVSFLRRQAAALLSASRTRAAKTKREIK